MTRWTIFDFLIAVGIFNQRDWSTLYINIAMFHYMLYGTILLIKSFGLLSGYVALLDNKFLLNSDDPSKLNELHLSLSFRMKFPLWNYHYHLCTHTMWTFITQKSVISSKHWSILKPQTIPQNYLYVITYKQHCP